MSVEPRRGGGSAPHCTDHDVEEALSCAPTSAWRELFEVAHRFLAQPEDVAYQGTRVDPVVVDGEECLSFPHAVYSDEVHRIVSLLYEVGAVFPFDWMKWDGVRRYRGRTLLRTAPMADAVRMATAIVRGERFCEGRIGSAIRDGTFSAMLERLLRWYDSERALDGRGPATQS